MSLVEAGMASFALLCGFDRDIIVNVVDNFLSEGVGWKALVRVRRDRMVTVVLNKCIRCFMKMMLFCVVGAVESL